MGSRPTIIAVIAAFVIIGGGAAFWALYERSGVKTPSDTMSGMHLGPSAQGTATGKTSAQTNSVAIENFAFTPANITISKGTTVTWTNKDAVAHTVTETDGKTGPNSGNLAQGKSFTFTFDNVGTYQYHCAIHPDMVGTVTVTN